MAEKLRILGIAGSLRRGSYNRGLVRAAGEVLPPDTILEIYEGLGEIPPYNADVEQEGDPAPVRALKDRMRASDGLLIASPEYNYNVPGVLKNAIDWASRPPGPASALYHKPIALMGASTGNFGTARAQLSWRQTFLFTTSYVLLEPQVYVFHAADRFDADSNLKDDATKAFIKRLVNNLADWTRQLQAAGSAPRATAAG